MIAARALAFVAIAIACACGPAQRPRGAVRPDDAIVYVTCDVPDAAVWVNDRLVGLVRDVGGGIALSAGTHRIELRHDRYHTTYLELTVAARERKTVPVELAEVLP